jgi:hypothetical protein
MEQRFVIRKWILISNTINVVAFILFSLSKLNDLYPVFYLAIATFMINGIITANYYVRTIKLKAELKEYHKFINQFYIRMSFILFFLIYGAMILSDTIPL